jgi:hypothetical protein
MQATSDSAAEVFAHVDRHAAIYARELRTGTAGLAGMLAEQFSDSITLLFTHGAVTPPTVDDDDPEQLVASLAAGLAAIAVAVITIWVAGPEPRDQALVARRWRAMLPPWWPVAP